MSVIKVFFSIFVNLVVKTENAKINLIECIFKTTKSLHFL